MHWFKVHHGFCADSKLALIAHKLNIPRAHIISIFIDMLEYASKNHDRGSIAGYDFEVASFSLGLPENELRDASLSLRDSHVTTGDRIANWDKYQSPIDHTHAERQRRYRNRKKLENSTDDVNSDASLPSRHTSRDIDKRREDKKVSKRGSRFTLTQIPNEWVGACRQERPDLDVLETFKTFSDYWVAVPGSRGVKLDWDATWRNWVRKQYKTAKPATPPKKNVLNANLIMRHHDA